MPPQTDEFSSAHFQVELDFCVHILHGLVVYGASPTPAFFHACRDDVSVKAFVTASEKRCQTGVSALSLVRPFAANR